MMEMYVVGDPNPPWWAKGRLTAYRKNDGSVGYEYMDSKLCFSLVMGDVLVNNDGKVRRRKGVRRERD